MSWDGGGAVERLTVEVEELSRGWRRRWRWSRLPGGAARQVILMEGGAWSCCRSGLMVIQIDQNWFRLRPWPNCSQNNLQFVFHSTYWSLIHEEEDLGYISINVMNWSLGFQYLISNIWSNFSFHLKRTFLSHLKGTFLSHLKGTFLSHLKGIFIGT